MRLDRRGLLIGGGAGVGLLVAWAVWPRAWPANVATADGEHLLNGWVKIGTDGHVTVIVPQLEHGQGVTTALPQIVADELGADWRTVAVEAAPPNPIYANPLAAEALFGDAVGPVPDSLRATLAERSALLLTGGATSVRMFEGPLRRAGAAARALLVQAAADRWGVDWRECTTGGGFVRHGQKALRFAVLAEDAAGGKVPDDVLPRADSEGRLTGIAVPRLDAPAKVDGSANYAADIRLPDMVFASIRQGPAPKCRLVGIDRAAADAVPGARRIVQTDGWVAAIGQTWWAAEAAVAALNPRFEAPAPLPDARVIDAALDAALGRDGVRMAGEGDVATALSGGRVLSATYRAAPGFVAPLQPAAATASFEQGRLLLWMATAAPAAARAAAASAIGIGEEAVVLHPLMGGGGSAAAHMDHRIAAQVAHLAHELKVPVQLQWSPGESLAHAPVRPPALARMTAQIASNGAIRGWRAQVATPPLGRLLADRLGGGASTALSPLAGAGDDVAVAGAIPTYRLPAWAVDHHPLDLPIPVGWAPGGGQSAGVFFTESFLDELAHAAQVEPLSYRIAMLGGAPRLARCLSQVAALGGWQGGIAGSGQGIACHAYAGSYIAVLAEAGGGDGGRPRVDRLVAAVDCGRAINPDLVVQAIENGLLHGLAAALGGAAQVERGRVIASQWGTIGVPRLSDCPEITVELVQSEAESGGVSGLAVPVVAPAVANALFAATGVRHRTLPLIATPA